MKLLTGLLLCAGLVCLSVQAQTVKSVSPTRPKAAEENVKINRADIINSVPEFILSRIGDGIVQEMDRAWREVGAGADAKEAVLMLFRMADGSIQARPEGITNEHKSFTLKWHPSSIAILHTHPTSVSPRPSKTDRQLADKLGVPIFTITIRGMYVYDPKSKDTWMVKPGLEWLDASKWTRN